MRRLLLSGLAVAFAGASFATSTFFQVDWPTGPGTDCLLSNFDSKYCGTGTISLQKASGYVDFTDFIGIYNYKYNNSSRVDVICAEVDRNKDTVEYEYKDIRGVAGYVASQIKDIVSNYSGQAQIERAMALNLATWELAYDFSGYTYGFATNVVDLDNGAFKISSPLTLKDGTDVTANVKALAAAYATAAFNSNPSAYRLYHAPRGGQADNGSQDLIGSVPGPAAVLPFLLGFGAAVRRRRK